jgi:hypothetical protein
MFEFDDWQTIYQLKAIAERLFDELNTNTRNAIAPYAVELTISDERLGVSVFFMGEIDKEVRLKRKLKKNVLALSLLFAEVFFDEFPMSKSITSCVIYMRDGKFSVSY